MLALTCHLAVRDVVFVCQQWLWQLAQEIFQDRGAIVWREHSILQTEVSSSAVQSCLQEPLPVDVPTLTE